jgi:hypothetical protein
MFTEVPNSRAIFRSLTNDNLFCMDYNPTDTKYPEELINYAFNREVSYLTRLQDYPWIPEVTEVDRDSRKIYFKWYQNTCETVLPKDYKEQLLQITTDLHNERIYKPSFYTKFFYVDNNNRMRAMVWYSASDYDEQPLGVDFFKPILNQDRLELVESMATNGKLDVGLLIKKAYKEYIQWPDNPLPEIYDKVYGI